MDEGVGEDGVWGRGRRRRRDGGGGERAGSPAGSLAGSLAGSPAGSPPSHRSTGAQHNSPSPSTASASLPLLPRCYLFCHFPAFPVPHPLPRWLLWSIFEDARNPSPPPPLSPHPSLHQLRRTSCRPLGCVLHDACNACTCRL